MKSAMLKRLEALNTVDEAAHLLKVLDAQLAALRAEAFRCVDGEQPEDEEHEKTI